MKNKFLLALAFFNFACYSQNLFITKSKTENSVYSSAIQEVNCVTGTIANDYRFNRIEPQQPTPGSLVFDDQTNTIYSCRGNRIFKFDLDNYADERPIGGSSASVTPYSGLVLVNDRLFATRTVNVDSFNYLVTIIELNKTDGAEISSHVWSSPVYISTNGYGITHSNASHTIFIMVGNQLLKYNILTATEATFALPGTDFSTYYPGIFALDNRLFLRKQDFANNKINHYMLELNQTDASLINTQVLTTNLNNFFENGNIVYLANTKEICGLFYGLHSNVNQNKILKYNIQTHEETVFDLPIENATSTLSENFLSLVTTTTENMLATDGFQQETNPGKIVDVYNMLGQKVPLETYDQVIIVVYENGSKKKRMLHSK